MAIDVSSINVIQGILFGKITNSFSLITIYARHLLYYFIAFEIVFSGLAWMFYQNQLAERLFFQILKIGLVLFLVENYASLLNAILNSSLIIGQGLSQSNVDDVLLNPGLIWQYAYSFSISLLQNAAAAEGFAFPMILMVLGFGILLTFGLFGIQVLIQVVAFYLVGAMSLLVLPLSVFSPLSDFFSRSLRAVLQASVRLMVQILLVSAAWMVYASINFQSFTPGMNINTPLGLLFSGILFVCASAYLPRITEKVIGMIHWQSAPSVNTALYSTTTAPSPGTHGVVVANTISAAQLPAADAIHLKPTMSSPSLSIASPTYLHAVKEDFFAKQKSMLNLMPELKFHDQTKEKKRLEDIDKIKQAFYEVLKELKALE